MAAGALTFSAAAPSPPQLAALTPSELLLDGSHYDRVWIVRGEYHAGRIDVARELSDAGWWIVRAVASGLRRSAADLAGGTRG